MVCHLRMHHRMVRRRCPSLFSSPYVVASLFILVVVAPSMLICEVLRALVFVCAAILSPISIALIEMATLTYVLEPPNDLIDVR